MPYLLQLDVNMCLLIPMISFIAQPTHFQRIEDKKSLYIFSSYKINYLHEV